MDLSTFSAVESLDVTIYHPAFEDGKEPIFTVAGPSHPATLRADRERSESILKNRGKRGDAEKLMVNHVAGRLLGWKNVSWKGEPLEFSRENALMLLSAPNLKFVRDQIITALGDDESFFRA